MAYRTELNGRAKGGAVAAVVAIHAALLFALLHISGKADIRAPDNVLRIFDIASVPPAHPPERPRSEQPKPKQKQGGSAPKNIKSQATALVAPRPQIQPQVQQIAATDTPREGVAPTQGASDVRGPGTGAGGVGNGTGNGVGGNGPGGGGGIATSASLLRGISGSDYPEEIARSWPSGGIIYVRLRVEPNGRPSRCDVMRSFGDPMADQWTCALLMQHSQFRPALDVRGVPVASWFGYKQVDISR